MREKDEVYLSYIRQLPCCLCGNDVSVEAHHPRAGSPDYGKPSTGMGERASDKWAVPLCGRHHRELHAYGDERAFWSSYGFDPFAAALRYRLPTTLNQRTP